MIHHYIQKGHDHHVLLALNAVERAFYKASMVIEREERNQDQRALVNGLASALIGSKGR